MLLYISYEKRVKQIYNKVANHYTNYLEKHATVELEMPCIADAIIFILSQLISTKLNTVQQRV